MSAKDTFFKKVQENSQAQQSKEVQVKQDIKQFQIETMKLTQQIKGWLDGSGIEIVEGETELHDDTVSYALGNTSLMRYSIANLVMKNGVKSAKLIPDFLYGFGFQGKLTLTIETPNRSPSKQIFSLHMYEHNQSEEGWHLICADQRPAKRVLLNEDVFFETIGSIA
jgi:hypothetical protein